MSEPLDAYVVIEGNKLDIQRVYLAADHIAALSAKDARIAELEGLLRAAWPMLNGATGDFHCRIQEALAGQQQAEPCEDMAEQLERAEIRMMFGDAQEPATHSEEARDMVLAALSPENQRITPVEPLLAPEHPMAAAHSEDGREVPGLWAVHAQGPDDMYAAFDREDAEKHASELNALPMPAGISVSAVVIPSPWTPDEHWQYLAEQEREHVAQHSRIVAAKDAEIARLNEESSNGRCRHCDGTGDIHNPIGEWICECPHCLNAELNHMTRQRDRARAALVVRVEAHEKTIAERDELRAQLDTQPASQVGGDREDMQTFIELFAERLLASGAANYLEDSFDLEFEATGKKCLVVIRLQHPDKPTPHQMRMEAEARAALAPVVSQVGGDEWRCFHCDEHFTDKEQAALHFGTSLIHNPACQIDIAEYRAMESRMERYNEEDADIHRRMYGMQTEHQLALRREEEKGYARGLKDAALAAVMVVAMPGRGEVARYVVSECDRKPGANYWTAAELAYDEIVARLNRRAIPVGLLEKAADLLKSYQNVIDGCHSSEIERFDYQPEVQGTADELRALLGKDGET